MLTIEDAKTHPLWDEQVALETEMRSLGVEAYRKATAKALEKGQETRTAPVRRLMHTAHHQMVEALKAFYAQVEEKKAGRKHSAYAYLKPIDVDVVAHLTCRVILDMSAHRKTLTHIAVIIAEALEDECNYLHFREQNVGGFLKAGVRAKSKGNARYKRQHVLGTAKKLEVNLLEWPQRDMLIVGTKLVELFLEATGLVVLVKTSHRMTIETHPDCRSWIEQEARHCELLAPTYLPTLIPPKPWTTPFEGAYWTGRARRLTLVKSPNRAYLEELANYEMPEVYQAVNALQNTAWHINHRVYDVMAKLWADQSTCGMVPHANDLELPIKPYWLTGEMTKEEMTPEQLIEFKEWKGRCVQTYDENAEMESKRLSFLRTLWVAEKFKDREEFFFPHTLDWRGRAYPVGLYLHPQGSDECRGLLEFSELCPINDQESANWLAIHGAGLWGKDKVSFEERCAWVEANTDKILASAADPYDNRFWQEADKPWQALAFCLDWAGFKSEGFGYLSALPIQMDGTCNGIQHFSAMLLDEVGGKAVNLIPGLKPEDIYMEVGKVVIDRVAKEAGEGHEYALMWHGRVERQTVKRPVMTLAYGAKRYGFTDMILLDTVRPLQKTEPTLFGNQGFQAAQYMAGLIWDAVGEALPSAVSAMQWLQELAKVTSKEALPIHWVTPTGLLVQQAYKVVKQKQIEIQFQKVRIKPVLNEPTDKLDPRRQASGISPNWVHSLDASAMMKTICASTVAGVRSFSFIHDSYGTHAGNTALLANALREQFVDMYGASCVLERFKSDLQAMLPEGVELPEVPMKGSLDLSQVLESPFFFA